MSGAALSVEGLCKQYPGFALTDVSFSLKEGRIMGFIGRNGAGKTTTLKSLLNFVHPDKGEIRFFGQSFDQSEKEIKERIGFVFGGVDFYPKKKLETITAVYRRFYQDWQEESYRKYLDRFSLDDRKTPDQLSAGMKVKYSLALALSHNARLLILDEPTSGLDPVSRDDLLDVFLSLSDEGKSILFSTHITSDLDKCADDITYIKEGKILASDSRENFCGRYMVASMTKEQYNSVGKENFLGIRRTHDGITGLVLAKTAGNLGLSVRDASLEDIMVHLEKE